MPLGVVELELAANPLNGKSRFSRSLSEKDAIRHNAHDNEYRGKQCNANRTIAQCALCTSLVSGNTQTHS